MKRARYRLAIALRHLAGRIDPVPAPAYSNPADAVSWHLGYISGRYGP